MIELRTSNTGALLLGTIAACTSPSPAPGGETPKADWTPPASATCNTAVPDAASAMKLAQDAKILSGFHDGQGVDGEGPVQYRGYDIGPMVPSQWPSEDCAVVFYVYETYTRITTNMWIFREPVTARITLWLDSGATQVDAVETMYLPGGSLASEADPLSAADEQPVFDAVARSGAALDLAALSGYQMWLQNQPDFLGTLDIFHREFLADLLTDRADLLELAHERSAVYYDPYVPPHPAEN